MIARMMFAILRDFHSAKQDFTEMKIYALHASQWKSLQVAIVLEILEIAFNL